MKYYKALLLVLLLQPFCYSQQEKEVMYLDRFTNEYYIENLENPFAVILKYNLLGEQKDLSLSPKDLFLTSSYIMGTRDEGCACLSRNNNKFQIIKYSETNSLFSKNYGAHFSESIRERLYLIETEKELCGFYVLGKNRKIISLTIDVFSGNSRAYRPFYLNKLWSKID